MPGMSAGMGALIAALIGAGTTGTVTGLEASGAIGGGSSGPSAQQQETLMNQQNQVTQQNQEKAAFQGANPTAQANTSGSLDNQSMAALIAQLSGSPADANLAQQTIFGTSPGLAAGGGS